MIDDLKHYEFDFQILPDRKNRDTEIHRAYNSTIVIHHKHFCMMMMTICLDYDLIKMKSNLM